MTRPHRLKLLGLALLSYSSAILTACATQTPSAVTDTQARDTGNAAIVAQDAVTIQGLQSQLKAAQAQTCLAPVPVTCSSFTPILYDRLKDTADTIRQVQAYDAALVAVCPQYNPKGLTK